MKIQKNIFQVYNRAESLLVISTYPKKGEIYSSDVDAIAPYTKKTILGFKKSNPLKKIVVLAPVIGTEQYSSYIDDGVLVIRCFKRNDALSFGSLLKNAQAFTNISSVLVEFEFSSYGDTKTTLALPVLLTLLALVQKKTTLVLHQVILDLATLSGHIGVSGMKTKVMNWVLRRYYALLCIPVKNVIVLEDKIRERLRTLVNSEKIHVSYHGIDAAKPIPQVRAKKKLGIQDDEFVILYFGYITWYKGADFLAQVFHNKKQLAGKRFRAILAGGPSITQNHKKHYRNFFQKVQSMVAQNKQIMITGFVKEEDLPVYMSAADLVLFPYRTFMSSSGALALAFAYEKPFLVSSKLREYFESRDITKVLQETGMEFEDISFSLHETSLLKAIRKAGKKKNLEKLQKISRAIKHQRKFSLLAKEYLSIIASKKRFTFSLPRHLQLNYAEK